MARHAPAGAGSEYIRAPRVLALGKSGGRIETASGKHNLPVKARLRVAQRVHLNHAAHFPSIFGRKPGGVDPDRLHIVSFDLRPEARGSIVGQRNSIDHKLRLILRVARMQDGVALVEPSRLRVHKVLMERPGMELTLF